MLPKYFKIISDNNNFPSNKFKIKKKIDCKVFYLSAASKKDFREEIEPPWGAGCEGNTEIHKLV